MKRYTYLLAYLVFMAIPASIFLYFVYGILNLKAMLIVIIFSFLIGGVFDIWAVRQGKKDKFYIWEYNSSLTLGKKIFGVPFEDFSLFLLLTPIFMIGAWEFAKILVILQNISLGLIVSSGIVVITVLYFITYRIARPKK